MYFHVYYLYNQGKSKEKVQWHEENKKFLSKQVPDDSIGAKQELMFQIVYHGTPGYTGHKVSQ